MINHLRTLLLNELPDSTADNEQYVPSTFRPILLPPDAAAVRAILIDQSWPRPYRNFVATLLSNITMDTPFASWLDRLDDRTTISPRTNAVASIQNTVSVQNVTAAQSLSVTGVFASNPAKGVFSGDWRIQKVDDTHVSILNLHDASLRVVPVTFTGDTTAPLPIDPSAALVFQLVGVSSVPAGMNAIVRAANSMTYDVMDAINRLRSDGNAVDVFRQKGGAAIAPMLADTFHNSPRPDLALAAILTAYAYRLEGL